MSYEKFDSGKFGRISESIEHSRTNILNEDSLSEVHTYSDGVILNEPINFYRKNKGFLLSNSQDIILEQRFFYNPRHLAKKLYGTTELYLMLLEMNNMASSMDFYVDAVGGSIKVLDPQKVNLLIDILVN